MHTHFGFISFWLLIGLVPLFAARAEDRVRRNVEIEWEATEGASLYEIQMVRKDLTASKPLLFKVPTAKWSANVRPGLYDMRIRAYDDRGVPGEWGPAAELTVKLPAIIVISPQAGATIPAREAKTEEILLKWEAIPGAIKYRVKVRSTTTNWQQELDTESERTSVKVPVAQSFEWNVTPFDNNNHSGELSSHDYQFDVVGPPLARPAIQKPMSKFVREVSWSPSEFGQSYSYELKYLNPKSKSWEKVLAKERGADLNLNLDTSRPSGKYRLSVQAHGERRRSSPISQLDFQMRGGFRDPAALERAMIRDSIVKPTNFYAIASYLITKVSYASVSQEDNSAPSFSAVGGTGRIGGGYQSQESRWGGFAIVDLSGFIVDGQNFRFSSAEIHITNKIELGQKGILMAASGVFSKEMPIIRGTAGSGFQGMGVVRNMGPHAGFIYWLPLNDRLGLQANARAYYTLTGSSTTGTKIQSSLSYQYGLLGSYRLGRSTMGYAGYAFRHDQAAFGAVPSSQDPSSYARDGALNTITIDGHYLNLVLEFSF